MINSHLLKRRICLFIDNTSVLGGAERVILDITKLGSPKGLDVLVALSPLASNWAELVRENGGKVMELRTGQEAERWYGLNLLSPLMFLYLWRMRNLMKDIETRYGKIPVLVQMYKEQILSFLAGKMGLPLFWIQHPHPPFWVTSTPLRYIYAGIANRYVSRIVTGSASVKKALVRMGVRDDKIKVVPNGIEIPNYIKPNRTELDFCRWYNITAETKVLSTHGRLHPHKGQAYLLMAVKELVKNFSSLKVIIVGDGGFRSYLENLTLALNLTEQVIFTGYYPRLSDILAISDVWISPSLNEGFSLSILEAMGYGLPVIATCVGGTKEIIKDGYDGRLVPPADIKAMAMAIKELLLDSENSQQLGRRAREKIINHYSLNRFSDAFLKALDI